MNFGQCCVARYHALPTAHSQHQEETELLFMACVVSQSSLERRWTSYAGSQLWFQSVLSTSMIVSKWLQSVKAEPGD